MQLLEFLWTDLLTSKRQSWSRGYALLLPGGELVTIIKACVSPCVPSWSSRGCLWKVLYRSLLVTVPLLQDFRWLDTVSSQAAADFKRSSGSFLQILESKQSACSHQQDFTLDFEKSITEWYQCGVLWCQEQGRTQGSEISRDTGFGATPVSCLWVLCVVLLVNPFWDPSHLPRDNERTMVRHRDVHVLL